MTTKHRLLSASKAPRWSRCAGSPLDGDGGTSVYAAEGTAAHAVAAACLKRGDDVKIERDSNWAVEGFAGHFEPGDLAAIQAYLDYCRAIPGVMLVEQELELPGERGGTGDCVILDHPNKALVVIDLKFGRGERVEAEGNEQPLEYAVGALVKFNMAGPWDTVTVAIAQPRLDHWPMHEYTRDELISHDARMQAAASDALKHQGDPKWRVAGVKQCRWCPDRFTCRTRAEAALEGFPVDGKPDTGALTPTELAEALERVEFNEDWCADIRAAALACLNSGTPLPGWKMVTGKLGNRAWADKKAAEGALTMLIGDAAYQPREVGSPTDMDKLMKKKFPCEWEAMQTMIVRAPGRPTLAREYDPRPALQSRVSEFPMGDVL
jgi:hypothetical protein